MSAAPLPGMDPRPLVERIRPHRLDGIVGNREAVQQLRAWADRWSTGNRPPRFRAALLEGPPGVGKTTAALALAHEHGWSIVEMNASDARNQRAIEMVAGRASLTATLGDDGVFRRPAEGGRTLIVLDEADSLTGRTFEVGSERAAPVTLREFLRSRYVTIAALNAAWGLGAPGGPKLFSEWSDLPASGGRAAWGRLPPAQRDLAEWKADARPHDYSDRGGLGAIVRLVRDTRQPLILIVNDTDPLFRNAPGLRAMLTSIRFGSPSSPELKAFLRSTILQQSLLVSGEALDGIVRRSRGDVRGALNDLEVVAALPPDHAAAFLGARESTSDLFDFVGSVFREPRFYRSVEIRDRADASPDDLFPWFEENFLRFAATPEQRWAGLEGLGRAELALARARRARVWGLWSFAGEIMSGGSALRAAGDRAPRDTTVGFPQILSSMGRSRYTRQLRQAAAGKAGAGFHVSRRKATEFVLPFLEGLFEEGPRARGSATRLRSAVAVVEALGLSREEVGVVLGVGPEDPLVSRLVPRSRDGSAVDSNGDEAPTEKPSPRAGADESGAGSRAAPARRRGQRRLGGG
ncbi:MAG: AAA family ATPase [Thermoplasmata archaeon]|nr:AAA family ATPase [Thermoplasmata archaeon]